MLVRELCKHFPARAPEWINAATMMVWGAYVVLHPSVLEQSYFAGLKSMAWTFPAGNFWGLLTFAVGFVRMAALFVNGAYNRTPIIRLSASLVSAFVWSQIVIGLWILGDPSAGLVMYGSAVCVDLLSAYRASKDVAMVESTRRDARVRDASSGGTGKLKWRVPA